MKDHASRRNTYRFESHYSTKFQNLFDINLGGIFGLDSNNYISSSTKTVIYFGFQEFFSSRNSIFFLYFFFSWTVKGRKTIFNVEVYITLFSCLSCISTKYFLCPSASIYINFNGWTNFVI